MTNETTPTGNGAADAAAIMAASMSTEQTESSSSEAAVEAPAEPKPPSFDDLGLHPDVKLALDDMGYFAPMAVQTSMTTDAPSSQTHFASAQAAWTWPRSSGSSSWPSMT